MAQNDPKMAILGHFWGPFWDPLFGPFWRFNGRKCGILAIWAQKGVPKWTPKMTQKWVILGAKKPSKKPIAIVYFAQNLHKSSRLFLTFFSGFWPIFDPLETRFGQKSILEQRAGENGLQKGGQKVTFPIKQRGFLASTVKKWTPFWVHFGTHF